MECERSSSARARPPPSRVPGHCFSRRSRGLAATKKLMKGTVALMGVMKRVSLIFRAKANKALDKIEDPRETLDYSYQKQLELLQKVRRGVADVATSRKRARAADEPAPAAVRQAGGPGPQGARRWAARTWPARRCPARPALQQPGDRPGDAVRPRCRARRRSSRSPRSGCRPRSTPSAPRRRPSRPPTPRPRRRPGSTRRSPASPRRWATSAWRSSGPRTRPRSCRPAPAPSTS